MAILLFFGNSPKEAIHLFVSHNDTVHTEQKNGELSFEAQHHHCDFLGYALPPFIAVEATSIFFSLKTSYPQVFEQPCDFHLVDKRSSTALRGPPAVV